MSVIYNLILEALYITISSVGCISIWIFSVFLVSYFLILHRSRSLCRNMVAGLRKMRNIVVHALVQKWYTFMLHALTICLLLNKGYFKYHKFETFRYSRVIILQNYVFFCFEYIWFFLVDVPKQFFPTPFQWLWSGLPSL